MAPSSRARKPRASPSSSKGSSKQGRKKESVATFWRRLFSSVSQRGKRSSPRRGRGNGKPVVFAAASVLFLVLAVLAGFMLAPSPDRERANADEEGKSVVLSSSIPHGSIRTTDPLSAQGVRTSSSPSFPQPPSDAEAALRSPDKTFPSAPEKPMIAIVIDDMGIDRKRTQQVIALPAPLTTSFLTYADALNAQTAKARQAGHEIFMHVPMEPKDALIDPGPNVLQEAMTPEQIVATLERVLPSSIPFSGINNHMGSRFTENAEGMRTVMSVLKGRGLIWLDSKTTPHSIGRKAAYEAGVLYAERTVFIDHEDTPEFVQRQLAEIEAAARRNGHVVAIGHPRDNTVAGLRAWLPTLSNKGFVLVPVSSIVASPEPGGMRYTKNRSRQ